MAQHILVIATADEASRQLLATLQELGYSASGTVTLTTPSAQDPHPALCLLDLTSFNSADLADREAWLLDCQVSQTACLVLHVPALPEEPALARLDPLVDILADPADKNQLSARIHSLLTIRKLQRQLNATRHQLNHYQEELLDALQSAASIQRSLIPKRQPRYHNLQFAWRYMPCKQVGGDLFNIVQLDEQTVMTYLVDVSGHGISSAMVTVSVHQSLSVHTGQLVKRPTDHSPFYEITPPGKVLDELEVEYPFERFEEFFTISYLLINPHTGHLRYSNAGHPPPLLLRKDGRIEHLAAGGTIIGIGEQLPFEEGQARLCPGDRLFLYTDGITEHLGTGGDAYGEQRFLAELQAQSDRPLDDATRDALIAMRAFGGSTLPIDDVTLIGIEFR